MLNTTIAGWPWATQLLKWSLATAASAAFPLDTVFGAAQADSPVHRFDKAAVLLPLASAAGSMAVVAGSKVAAVAAEIES